MAELIVNQAKTMPIETGVALECNGARIAKVSVTGGFGGYNVTSADGKSRLIFPMAEVTRAVESFLTEGRFGVEAGDWEKVRFSNCAARKWSSSSHIQLEQKWSWPRNES